MFNTHYFNLCLLSTCSYNEPYVVVQMDLIKERPLEFIGDITDKKDFWKLAVRVQDKWTVVKNGKEHLELVIVDSKVMYFRTTIYNG
jgi:hypothetical protein